MMGREQKLYEEAAALWQRLYGEPPPVEADGARILDLIVGALPDASYARLSSPHLRPSAVAFAKYRAG